MKHTPGPWRIRESIDGGPLIYGPGEYDIVFPTNGFMNKANAQLIAAGPELLEMLKEVTSEVQINYLDFMDEESVGYKSVSDIVARAFKVIAKAEGK